MHTVSMRRATCGHCKRDFPYPFLGDFSYGLFILHREDGRAFRYLEASGNAVWDFAAARVRVRKNERVGPGVMVLQEVIARLADPSEGKSFTMDMICPHCKSHRFRDWGGDEVSSEDIPDATFESFSALDESSKERLVGELERLVNAEQAA